LGIRSRLAHLGWSEKSWVEGERPASYRIAWYDLPFPQRVTARLLGFTMDTWEGCVESPCLERFSYVKRKYVNTQWPSMNLAQQRAWMMLGHTEPLWEVGGQFRAEDMQVRWDELSPEKQGEAIFLGHSSGTWQGCNEEWSPPGTSNVTNNTQPPPDPYRAVRVRMVIERPFSEISGNVYGSKVAQMPTSFIKVFERSIARALFCGNPNLDYDKSTYVNNDGSPLCILQADFERQHKRVQVVTVEEHGGIVVDFFIAKNNTVADDTPEMLFEALVRQLQSPPSPLTQDSEFGRFAEVASAEEIPLSNLSPEERAKALEFERMRAMYNDGNACQLVSDGRNGAVRCGTSAAHRLGSHDFGVSLLVTLAAAVSISAAMAHA
jgi:hypothetical protein